MNRCICDEEPVEVMSDAIDGRNVGLTSEKNHSSVSPPLLVKPRSSEGPDKTGVRSTFRVSSWLRRVPAALERFLGASKLFLVGYFSVP